jgi:hypothetical protein
MPKRSKEDASDFSTDEEIPTKSTRRTRHRNNEDSDEAHVSPVGLEAFWPKQMEMIQNADVSSKSVPLPISRIKRVMKLDEQMEGVVCPVSFIKLM